MFKTKKDMLEKEINKEEKEELEDAVSEKEQEPGSSTGEQNNMKEKETEKIETGSKEVKGKEKKRESDLQSQLDEMRDKLLRKAAEFENYKRRNETELASFFKFANENLITELLPVMDDFERVLKSWNEKHDVETFKKGGELIYHKFKKVLDKQGVKEIDSTGKPFDVNLHDALLQTPTDEAEPNTVLETVEKGYYLKDKVVRHAKVIVSAPPEKDESEK
jgi:molecular chaperone GrpE